MIVDHDSKFRKQLRGLLEQQGYQITTAKNGADALAKAEHAAPDLVISDLQMPVMCGHTLLRHFKTREEFSAIPFVVYSDFYVNPTEDDLAWGVGADAFITKPAAPSSLISLLEELLGATAHGESYKTLDPVFEAEVLLQKTNAALVQELQSKVIELTQANNKLAANEARLKLLMDSMPVCVVLTDASVNIVQVNPTSLRLFKARTLDQLIGLPLLDVVAKDYHQALASLIKNVFAGADDLQECEIVDLLGVNRWVEITATPVADESGNIASSLLVLRDIDFKTSYSGKNRANTSRPV